MTTIAGPIDKKKKGPAITLKNQDRHGRQYTGESHIQQYGRNATMINAQHT
jgi:hypothetical protein